MKRTVSLALSLTLVLSPNARAADIDCITALLGKIRAFGKTKVSDLDELGRAMTEGMLLNPHQSDVFEIYRSLFFGELSILNNQEPLSHVIDTLKKYPEIKKPHFREFEIEVDRKIFQSPESLRQHVRSQTTNAGRIRSNLFQIDANIGYWKKLLRQKDLPSASKEENQKQFYRYLDAIISEKNRRLLRDNRVDYRLKIKTLFYTLRRVAEHMDKNGKDSLAVRQALVDLVAATGFSNKTTQELLKSNNALDRMEALRRVIDERESMAIELGYKNHFQALLKDLRVPYPSLMGKGADEAKLFSELERAVAMSPSQFLPSQRYRVRSLSLHEAPFRSCVGGSDCSTYTYFQKAFDPNFYYFTLTDQANHSDGQATIVLGSATAADGKVTPAAFVDKLQNLPNQMIISFLEAIRRAVAEKGYVLVLPEDVGDHNGLSNILVTREFVAKGILPLLGQKVTEFTPHPNKYDFEGTYSRAHLRLSGRIFEQTHTPTNFRIETGKTYTTNYADPNLSRTTLRESLYKWRDSQDESDIRKYIQSSAQIERTDHIPFIPAENFIEDLIKIANQRSLSFETRKMAYLEVIALDILARRGSRLRMRHILFDDEEKKMAFEELQGWAQSSNDRKKIAHEALTRMWFEGGRVFTDVVSVFLEFHLVDPNLKNKNGKTALILAVINNNLSAVKILLNHPQVDISARDDRGFTALDYARGLGQDETAALIRNKKPGSVHLNETHSPPPALYQQMDFAIVPRGSFVRTNGSRAFIEKPFEIQTTLFTQHMYVMVMESATGLDRHAEDGARMKINGKMELIFPNHPISGLSLEMVDEILKRINAWANREDPQIYQLIPSHRPGSSYEVISADQLEFVMSLAKTESGDSVYELINMRDWNTIYNHSWLAQAMGPKPVATKKPVWLDRQPIYDLAGNLRVLTKEGRSMGVSWLSGPHSFPNSDIAPGSMDVGLRLVRISP